ncbi:MAG: prohibitin family protein [Armatimonadetes bacterium]|nr:prohibitin family protein [Armatimonadota bacterium]
MKRAIAGTVALVVIFVALVVALKAAVVVGAGERAVVFSISGGTKSKNLNEGLRFVVPFLESVRYYDVRVQNYTMSARQWEGAVQSDDAISALTSDGQSVKLDVSLLFHLDPNNVWQLHQKVGPDYIAKIIRPELTSVARNVVSAYPATDVYSLRRREVENQVQERLTDVMKRNYILVDELLVRDVQFSEAFHQAIERKQIAQQQAQRMQYVLQKAKMEKEQRVIEADGDAKAIRLKGQALAQNARLVQYEYLQKIAPNVDAIITDGRNIGAVPGAP